MKVNVYAVFDSKACVFQAPFTFSTDGQALRAFENAARSEGTAVGQNPEDYSLFRIGRFDDASGMLEPDNPENMGLAAAMLKENYGGTE